MWAAYLRIALAVVGAILAIVLFALAFTTAAIVVLVLLLVGVIFGRKRMVFISRRTQSSSMADHPKVIDHDPNAIK